MLIVCSGAHWFHQNLGHWLSKLWPNCWPVNIHSVARFINTNGFNTDYMYTNFSTISIFNPNISNTKLSERGCSFRIVHCTSKVVLSTQKVRWGEFQEEIVAALVHLEEPLLGSPPALRILMNELLHWDSPLRPQWWHPCNQLNLSHASPFGIIYCLSENGHLTF